MQKNSLKWMAAFAVAAWVASPASAQTMQFFFDGFDQYPGNQEALDAGWEYVDANDPESEAWWSLQMTNWRTTADDDTWQTSGLDLTPRHFPPTYDGTPTGELTGSPGNWNFDGNYMISDADAREGPGQDDVADSGQSHDLITPVIDCSNGSSVWLHFDCSAVLNDNGKAVFIVDVTADGDQPWDQATWNEVFVRVAPDRGGNWNDGNEDLGITTYRVDNTNADGVFGRIHLDLSQYAAGEDKVRVRFRHYEQDWDWWIAVDNVLVNNVAGPEACATEVFSHNFDGGAIAPMVVESTDNEGTLATWNTQDPNERYGLGWVNNQKVNRLNHATGQEDPNFAVIDEGQIGGDFFYPRDEWLKTPVLDCSNFAQVVLDYEDEFIPTSHTDGTGEDPGCVTCDVTHEVVVSIDGGNTWEQLFDVNGGGLFAAGRNEDPMYQHRFFNAPQAAGQSEVVFAWHYESELGPDNAGYWAVDNVRVTGCSTADFDSDNDGIADVAETGTGSFIDANDTGSDVKNADSDGDGWMDGVEVAYGSDPNDDTIVPTIPEGEVPVATFAGLAALAGALVVAARRIRK